MNSDYRGGFFKVSYRELRRLALQVYLRSQPNFATETQIITEKFSEFSYRMPPNCDGTPKIDKRTQYYQDFRATARVYRTKQETTSLTNQADRQYRSSLDLCVGTPWKKDYNFIFKISQKTTLHVSILSSVQWDRTPVIEDQLIYCFRSSEYRGSFSILSRELI